MYNFQMKLLNQFVSPKMRSINSIIIVALLNMITLIGIEMEGNLRREEQNYLLRYKLKFNSNNVFNLFEIYLKI